MLALLIVAVWKITRLIDVRQIPHRAPSRVSPGGLHKEPCPDEGNKSNWRGAPASCAKVAR